MRHEQHQGSSNFCRIGYTFGPAHYSVLRRLRAAVTAFGFTVEERAGSCTGSPSHTEEIVLSCDGSQKEEQDENDTRYSYRRLEYLKSDGAL